MLGGNRRIAEVLILSLLLTSPAWSLDQSRAIRSAWAGIVGQTPLDITPTNHVFLAGVVVDIVGRCGQPSDALQGARLARFLADGYGAVAIGRGGTTRQDLDRDPALVAGRQAASPLSCEDGLRALGRLLGVLRQRAEDRPVTPFVKSCEAGHDETACRCVEEMASDVLPGIGAMAYGPGIYARLFERNPLLTMEIPRLCGVDR